MPTVPAPWAAGLTQCTLADIMFLPEEKRPRVVFISVEDLDVSERLQKLKQAEPVESKK